MFRIWSILFQAADAIRETPIANGIANRRRSFVRAEQKTENLAPIIMIARRQPAALLTEFAGRLIYGNAKGKI